VSSSDFDFVPIFPGRGVPTRLPAHTSPRFPCLTPELNGRMSAVGVMVAAHCGRVEPRRPAISGTRSRNRGVPGRSTAVSCASTSESLDMCVITSADPPPPPCVSTRRGVVGTTLLSAFAAALFPNFALAEDDDESEEDAQAAIEASMRNVLKVNSGEFSYPRQVAFRDGSSMRASFEVSSLWSVVGKASTGGAAGVGAGDAESSKDSSKDAPKSTTTWQEIVDPVNGKVVQNVTLFFTKNFPSQSIADLGKPENVSVAKALGLASDDSYRRADMLGASKRTATDGQVYYDWDMVASPVSISHLPHSAD
jgi:hypothetical protein